MRGFVVWSEDAVRWDWCWGGRRCGGVEWFEEVEREEGEGEEGARGGDC